MIVEFLKTDSSSDASLANRVSALEEFVQGARGVLNTHTNSISILDGRVTSTESVANGASADIENLKKYDRVNLSYDDGTNKLTITKEEEGQTVEYLVDAEIAAAE